QPGVADLAGEPHASENLHAARIHALHLGQELRRFLLLDERTAHAAQAEIDRKREADRAGTNDEDLGVHLAIRSPQTPVSSPRRRGPIISDISVAHRLCHIAATQRMGPCFRGEDTGEGAREKGTQSRAWISPSLTWMV